MFKRAEVMKCRLILFAWDENW